MIRWFAALSELSGGLQEFWWDAISFPSFNAYAGVRFRGRDATGMATESRTLGFRVRVSVSCSNRDLHPVYHTTQEAVRKLLIFYTHPEGRVAKQEPHHAQCPKVERGVVREKMPPKKVVNLNYNLNSKLLQGGYIRDYIGDYYRGY